MFDWFRPSKKHLSLLDTLDSGKFSNSYDTFINYFEENPIINSIINLIANKIAHIDLENNEVISELCMKRIVMNLFLTGNCFILKNPDLSFVIIPSQDIIIHLNDQKTDISHYELSSKINKYKYKLQLSKIPKDQILNIKFLNPNNEFFGLSPLKPLQIVIESHLAVLKFMNKFIENSGRPSGVFATKYISSPTQRDNIRNELSKVLGGVGKNSSIGIIDGEFSWQQIGAFPKDMQLLEIKLELEKILCHSLGVPPILFGIIDAKFNNYIEAFNYFKENTIELNLKIILREFNQFLNTNIRIKETVNELQKD